MPYHSRNIVSSTLVFLIAMTMTPPCVGKGLFMAEVIFLAVTGVVEVYRVTKRVELGIKATAVCSEKLQELLKDISRVWNNLMGFMSLANLTVSDL